MARCFLSYSSAYSHLKEPFHRLLAVLGFEPVDVFDGPDLDSVPEVVLQTMRVADAVVVLYGPKPKPKKTLESFDGAKWPYDEAVLARGMDKPIALVVHSGTTLPVSLAGYQTPAQFDFWEPQSFLENVHHIIKHLVEFKRSVDGLPAGQPFLVREASFRYRILSKECVKAEIYHEIVAREPRNTIEHLLYDDTDETGDKTAEITLPTPEDLKTEVDVRLDSGSHHISIRPGACTAHKIQYFVDIVPRLEPGQALGYWRSFELPNWYPLTRNELVQRSAKPGYPKLYGNSFYGDESSVVYETQKLTMAIHFPRWVKLQSSRVIVVDKHTREEHRAETERCMGIVKLMEKPADPERVIELVVPQPLLNHCYYLLYELKD